MNLTRSFVVENFGFLHLALGAGTDASILHWGTIEWAYYYQAPPIAYFYYVRHRNVLKVSEALLPVLGEGPAHGKTGKLIGALFVFGV